MEFSTAVRAAEVLRLAIEVALQVFGGQVSMHDAPAELRVQPLFILVEVDVVVVVVGLIEVDEALVDVEESVEVEDEVEIKVDDVVVLSVEVVGDV